MMGVSNDIFLKCVSMAECVISLHKQQFTSFSQGLTLQMHHDHGSKQLTETLNLHGFCANYNKVKWFRTSAAGHEITKSQSCWYLPSSISPTISGGGRIQEFYTLLI